MNPSPGHSSHLLTRIFRFYCEGFRNMTVGKTLWAIILLKLFIFFCILRLFFFPDFLKTRFSSDARRAEYVIERLTQ